MLKLVQMLMRKKASRGQNYLMIWVLCQQTLNCGARLDIWDTLRQNPYQRGSMFSDNSLISSWAEICQGKQAFQGEHCNFLPRSEYFAPIWGMTSGQNYHLTAAPDNPSLVPVNALLWNQFKIWKAESISVWSSVQWRLGIKSVEGPWELKSSYLQDQVTIITNHKIVLPSWPLTWFSSKITLFSPQRLFAPRILQGACQLTE